MVTGFMPDASYVPDSMGRSFSGPLCGPYTPLSACGTDGARKRPEPWCTSPTMQANDSTLSSRESLSDEQEIEQLLVEEVCECRYLLRQTVSQDVDPEEIVLCVKEARARLEYLERVVLSESLID